MLKELQPRAKRQVGLFAASFQPVIIADQTANGHREEILQPIDGAFFMEKLEMLYGAMAHLSERLCSLERKLEPGKFIRKSSRNVSRCEGHRRQQMDDSEDDDENVKDVVERIPVRRRPVATNNLNKLERVRRETEKALKLQLELLTTELREVGRARYQFEEDRTRDLIVIVNREKEVQFLLERHRAGRTENRLVAEIKEMARSKESLPKNMKKDDLKKVGNTETNEMKVSVMRMVRKTTKTARIKMDFDLQNKNNQTMREKEIVVPIQKMPGILPAESQEAGKKLCVLERQTRTDLLKVMMAQEMEIQHLKKRCEAAQNKADEGMLKDYNRLDKTTSKRKELKQLHKETLQMHDSASETTNNEGGQRQSITEVQRSESKFKGTGKETDLPKLERKSDEVRCGEKLREMGDIPKKDGQQKNVPVEMAEMDMDLSEDRTGCLAGAVKKGTEEEKKTEKSAPKMQETERQTEHQEHEVMIVNKVSMTAALKHKELDSLVIPTGEQKNAVVQVKGGGKNTEDELFLEAFVPLTVTEKVIRKQQAALALSQETVKKQREKRDQENLREHKVFQQTEEMKDEIKRVENQNGEKEKAHSITEGKMAHHVAVKKGAMETTSRSTLLIEVDLLLEEISKESKREVTPMLSRETDKNELVSKECVAKEMKNEVKSRQARDLEKHGKTGGERQKDKTGSKNEKDNDILLGVEMLLKDMEEEENETEEARLGQTKKTNDKVKRQSDKTKLVVAQSRCGDMNPKGQVRNMEKPQPKWLQAWGEERAAKDCESKSPLETEAMLVTSLPSQRKEGRHRAFNREGDFDSVWWLEKADTQDQRGQQEQVTAGKAHDEVREMDLERQEQAEQEKEETINRVEERLTRDVILRSAQRVQERDDDIATFLAEIDARQPEREQRQEERRRKVNEANEIWSSFPLRLHESCLTETQGTGRKKKNVTFQVKLSNTQWWLQD